MIETGKPVKVIMKDDAIYCGACGHKLAETKGLRQNLGVGSIYLKCNHKDASKRCKTINQIDL